MRALAVMSVLLFHLWPDRIGGGYIGVDIFFVISGYLITSHLLRELLGTGRIRVGEFWARRARRLLPASLAVLFLTAISVVAWVPRSLWDQFLGEVVAAALYVENWRLASDSVDYLAGTNEASPVQHFWTLSVEEQFYVVLPLLLLLGVFVFKRIPLGRAALLVVSLGVLGSFAYGLWQTAWSPDASYFSTLTRAWEFGAGALIAFLPPLHARFRTPVAMLGLLGALAAIFVFSADTPFPGWAALLPVLAASAMILAGPQSFLAWAGRLAPVAFLGAVSYSAYLIHWPAIVIVPFVTGHELTAMEKLAILGATVIAAWFCTNYVENPIRFSRRLLGGRRPRVVAAWSAAGMALVIGVAGVALAFNESQIRAAEAQTAAIAEGLTECFGAASMDPALAPCTNADLDGVVVPALADAESDDDNRGECWSGATEAEFRVCTLGEKTGATRHVLAIGDSHNNTLVGAYESIAKAYGWRIDVAGHAGCYWTDTELRLASDEATDACAHWQDSARDYISGLSTLDAIVVTRSSGGKNATDRTVDGMVAAWQDRPANIPLIAILDNPRLSDDVVACVEMAGVDEAARCGLTREDAVFDDGQKRAAERVEGAEVVDLTDYYCSASTCPAIAGGVLVYRDGSHLTATYAATIAPYLGQALHALIG